MSKGIRSSSVWSPTNWRYEEVLPKVKAGKEIMQDIGVFSLVSGKVFSVRWLILLFVLQENSAYWKTPQFSTAGMVCKRNYEKLGGSSWFKIQAKSSLLGAKKLQGKHAYSFRTGRYSFPRTENGHKTSIAAYKLHYVLPAGTQGPPAGTQDLLPNFSVTWIRCLLTDFDEWPLVGQLDISGKRDAIVFATPSVPQTIAPF